MQRIESKSPHFLHMTPESAGEVAQILDMDEFKSEVFFSDFKNNIFNQPGSYFGFINEGPAILKRLDLGLEFELESKMYFSSNVPFSLDSGSGFVVHSMQGNSFFSVGGPLEPRGILKYIDGCSDSLLISPVLKGQPCLNFLHFPPNISQTRHTHPSFRIGIVTKGRGLCIVPENQDGTGSDVVIQLKKGDKFIIPANGHHSFFTQNAEMDVVAYHPDSDFGPEDTNHPMINKTMVDGISSSKIHRIRTKTII